MLRYRYLLIASAAIVIAIVALLFIQYRSVKRNQEYAQKTMRANLELHLLEIADDAKRGVLDHANHILHSIRQQRIRERNIPSIERSFTKLVKRYPEVEDCFVVFFDSGRENDTWRALKFVRPNADDPTFKGVPIGRLVEDAELSASLRRAWQAVPQQEQTALYTAFDPEIIDYKPHQYFFHTVSELDVLARDAPLENVGLLVFSARPDHFPATDYLKNLVAKHQERDKEIDGSIGKLDYQISLDDGPGQRVLASTGDAAPVITRRFDDSDKLFRGLQFGISSPELISRTSTYTYTQSTLFLALLAAATAVLGLVLTWRATRREMKVAQLKSDFLANISHELKTPLTAIRAFGDLLDSGRATKPERIREYGGIIKMESDRLTALINNILELSRIERGARKYRLERADLRDMVIETVDIFRHSPEAAEFDIKVTSPISPVTTAFDKGAIRQALINLLSNAAKYSGSNNDRRIVVDLRTESHNAVIEVRDFGIGIADEDQLSIFLPFHRSMNDEIQAKGGTGLGLAIVREFARGHGGEITLESKLGEGAVFKLHLPLIEEETLEEIEVANGAYLGHRGRA